MLRFFVRRLLGALPVLWGAVTVAFLIVHLLPGDPATLLLIRSGASAEVIAERRAMLGWDRPLPIQYGAYLLDLLRGDLGRSWASGDSVARLLAEQWPHTLELALGAMGVAVIIGIMLGGIAALRPGTWGDRLSMGIALLGLSTPIAWSGLLVIWLFSLILGWLPSGGQGGLSHLLLPAVVLGLASAGPIARLTRSGLIDVLSEPFITAARAKGLPFWRVLTRHVAPIMLPPVVTMLALQFGFLLGGVAVTEALFARQGIGRLAVQAILAQDLPVVQGIVLLGATVYTVVNLLADVAQWVLDPRGRL
ncbi:MAG: ABC transporter permease [Chloroflexi bacterium]|nr:ABC transporter permease [Chloroflexota bacterium]